MCPVSVFPPQRRKTIWQTISGTSQGKLAGFNDNETRAPLMTVNGSLERPDGQLPDHNARLMHTYDLAWTGWYIGKLLVCGERVRVRVHTDEGGWDSIQKSYDQRALCMRPMEARSTGITIVRRTK